MKIKYYLAASIAALMLSQGAAAQERFDEVSYTPSATTFRLNAPSKPVLRLYDEGLGGKAYKKVKLTQSGDNTWSVVVKGDLKGKFYTFDIGKGETPGVFAKAVGCNGSRGAVVDMRDTNPVGWDSDRRIPTKSPADLIIYELHHRDFSIDKSSGLVNKGKYLALTEQKAIDYLKKLGVNAIHILPSFDFASIDESKPDVPQYNWGYDPVQYNVPEGSFASDPEDPYARILELQETIAAYHEADMSLIMDVVYNHVYDADSFAFEKIVPGYFYRLDEQKQRTDGTFCGNDVASERAMVRRFIKHSVKQWVNLYGFDGFRFDLMGILDIQTMNELAEELKESYPNVYLYGEGWKMATGLDSELLAHQYNAAELTDYGFFSDNFRDTIKGTILNKQRLTGFEWTSSMANILTANVGLETASHFQSPQQAINYTECHDNATVFDYFKMEDPNISPKERLASARLALHLVLLAQGVPFLHSGQEFFRHKDLLDNSYNIPDTINRLDWQSLLNYEEDVDFIRELISFRKEHPLLSLESREEILEACQVEWLNDSLVRYQISQQDEQMTILINFGSKDQTYQNKLGQQVFLSYPAISSDKSIAPLADSYVVPAKQVLVLK